ncbi:MAG: hypothetical protein FK730_03365 [Asgard group archaeon]|nr:hypothetical protein [Asgard group archaeon]
MVREQQKWKLLTTAILIIIAIMITSYPEISADDLDLTYEIPKARLIAKMNNYTRKITQFDFFGEPFPEKTQIDLDVEYQGTAVSSNYIIDTTENEWVYTTTFLKLLMEQYIRYTYKMGIRLNYYWDSLTFENGVDFYLYPYIIPEAATWDYFVGLGEMLNDRYEEIAQEGHDVNFLYIISEKDNYFLFESWLGGEFNGQYGVITNEASTYSDPANVTFDNLFKIAINKQSGIISGFRMKGRVNGKINDDKMNVQFEYQYQEKGYHLANFRLGPNFIVDPYLGRKIAIASSVIIPVSVIASVVFILIRKRKAKKTPLIDN